ncbi:VOC family protein [Pseudomonadales bacterium]|nr:VOC family protein [Pseudomonadales bacterium]MDC1328754.1 VOC family protein [Pseudomonadales bacterium]MDC3343975.1 VOC family protein [Pseudomonadales bacterium]
MKSLLPHNVLKIAFVVDDIDKYLAMFAELFGIETPASNVTGSHEETQSSYRGEPTEGRIRVGYIPLENIVLELIEPVEGPSVWQDCLEQNGNGIHHLAFIVDGMEHLIGSLGDVGLPLLQNGIFPAMGAAPGGRYAFLEGLDKLGFDVELLEYDV